jgi:hypothetical protein
VLLLLMMLLRGGGGHLVCFGDADAALAQLVQDLAVVLRLPASLPGTAPPAATTKLDGQNPQGADPPPTPYSTRSEGRKKSFEQVNYPLPPHRDRRAIEPNHIKFRTCCAHAPMLPPL